MRHIFIALTNAAEGKDAEYNKWYDEIHLGEVLEVPGFVAAQRYQLNDAQIGSNHPYKYFTIYEMETEDPAATLAALIDRSSEMDTSLLGPVPMPALYTAIGGRVRQDDFKREPSLQGS